MDILDNDINYKNIVNDIINNNEFNKLSEIPHHGETRMEHSIKVSYYSYKISKFLKLNYRETARAGLLHDFYFDRTKDYKQVKDKVKLYTTGHPGDALKNADELFILSDKEKDIIKAHMFPLSFSIPKYLEAWVVNGVDTVISTYEFFKKFSYQLNTVLNVWLILLINLRK